MIDNNVMLNDINIKLIDLCKLINYGTSDIVGTYIFTKSFKYLEDNMDDLYKKFSRGGF